MHALHAAGLTSRQIAAETGIPRGTVLKWIRDQRPFERSPPLDYPYLLGIYLGDGTISRWVKGIWIIDEIAAAVTAVMPASRVGVRRRYREQNRALIDSTSKAWPCLFPQAGPGMNDLAGVEYRSNNRWNISVAKRDSVASLDRFVGPKR